MAKHWQEITIRTLENRLGKEYYVVRRMCGSHSAVQRYVWRWLPHAEAMGGVNAAGRRTVRRGLTAGRYGPVY